jgi:hypothetical protein
MGTTHAQLMARWTAEGGSEYAFGRLEELRAAQRGWSKSYYDGHRERVKGWVRRYQTERNPENFAKHQELKAQKDWAAQEKKAGRQRPLVCEICAEPEPKGRKLHFDHCHKSGRFRGWLCNRCNKALGMARDDPEILVRMAAYLELDRLNERNP